MTISTDAQKAFDKVQHSFLIKTLNRVGLGGISQHNRSLIWKPTVYMIFNGKKLRDFLLRSETGKGCPLSPLIFNIVLHILATAIRQQKEKKKKKEKRKHLNWKGRSKTFIICRWNTIYRKPLRPYQKTTKLIKIQERHRIQKSMNITFFNFLVFLGHQQKNKFAWGLRILLCPKF